MPTTSPKTKAFPAAFGQCDAATSRLHRLHCQRDEALINRYEIQFLDDSLRFQRASPSALLSY
jgi:hypothetical protein